MEDQNQNQSHAEYLTTRSGIRFYTEHCPRIPLPVVMKYFNRYYKLIYWSAEYIISSIEAGIIVRDDIQFKVAYKGITRGEILLECKLADGNPKRQFQLSFRVPDEKWNIPATVVISPSDRRII